jgi:3-oxoacyl-[acyl-carrier-protein] synthase II
MSDLHARPCLAITGMGAVSAAGFGVAALAELLHRGGSALRPGSRAALGLLDPGWIGEVPDVGAEPEHAGSMASLPNPVAQALLRRWGAIAAREALEHASVAGRIAGDRVALILGTNLEDHPDPLDRLVDAIARELGIAGPRIALSMACVSSTAGFALARALLDARTVDAVVLGGADVLTPRVLAAFRTLELLADGPCGPFGSRVGTSLGEGAGFLVLERSDDDHPTALAHVLGEGLAADGHHPTAPEPRGRGLADAITAALAQAGLDAAVIDHVDAHATGTAANDAAESFGLERVFGARVQTGAVSVSAVKSILGHAQGASGVLELIATLLAREHGCVPHNPGFVAPARPGTPADPVAAAQPQSRACTHLVSCSSGFGGNNVALVIGPARELAARAPRKIHLLASASAGANASGRLPELDWRRAVRGLDLRAADRTTQQLTNVVASVLRSHSDRPRRQEIGLFVGLPRACPSAIVNMYGQILERGLERAAARGLATSLTVIPTGECATALQLWGPTLTCCAGPLSGLMAVLAAAEQLRDRADLRAMIAATVDEDLVDRELPHGQPAKEGAAAWVLGDTGPIELAGWAITGPDHAEQAIERARALAGESTAIVVRVELTPTSTASGVLRDIAGQVVEAPQVFLVSSPSVASCALLLRPGG